MHLSLKGSLIRSPMLNRVGQRLLQLFEGASAAYSLRDLASNIASVVRVRRASDNSEKDFSAADVSSGAMTQWVNGQVVPPLDVRELVDGERTGALIPAAAAYSLRNLSTSYTGNVVDVRRSSDDAEDSFTAAEVADGTLEDWVNGNWENVNYSTFTNGESWEDGFTAINTTSSGAGLRIPSGTTGDVITISFNLTLNSGTPSPSISLRNSAGGSVSSNIEVVSTAGSHSLTLTATGSYSYITIGESDVPSGFSISNVILNVVPNPIFDGFVTQWYDQSGNANHATQGTDASQPKIVDAGSLVSGGLSIGSGQHLSTTLSGTTFALNNASSFVLGQASGGQGVGALTTIHNLAVFSSPHRFGSTQGFRYGGESASSQPRNASVQLFTLIGDSTTAEGFANGTSYRSRVSSSSSYNSPVFKIGSYSGNLITGKVEEIIVYDSDQSANRTAFEANIGETYGIDLPSGVDTGYDQVDGFVETWYDQSGNGNDAVQETAGSQPKIVDAGVLVSGGLDFNGSSSAMDIDGLALESIEYFMTAVIDLDTVPSNSLRTIFDSTDATNAGAALAYANTSSQLTPFMFDGDDTSVNVFGGGANLTASKTLVGCQFKSGASESYINGGVNSTLSNTWTSAGTNTFTKSTIGYDQNTPGRSMNGKLAELIVYESDQSANRVAIEANINNQYDIY